MTVYALDHEQTDDCTFWFTETICYSRNKQQLQSICDKLKKKTGGNFYVDEVKINDSFTKQEIDSIVKSAL